MVVGKVVPERAVVRVRNGKTIRLVFAVSTMTPDEAPVEPPERAINAK